MRNQMESVRNLMNGYKFSYLLIASVRVGIFDALLKGYNTCEKIEELLKIKRERIELLLNALVALGLVEKESIYYSLTNYKDIFSRDSVHSQVGYINYALNMTEKWRNLEKVLLDDAKDYNYQNVDSREENEVETFLQAMNTNAVSQAIYLVKNYNFENNYILDIGAGYGTHSIIIAKEFSSVRVRAFDFPMVTKILAKNIKHERLEERIQITEGDYRINLPNEDYDAIFLFAIIHQDEEEEINHLLDRIYKRLRCGGKIYLISYFLEDNKVEPLFSVMFGIEMLVRYGKGKVYTHSEMRTIFANHGFSDVIRDDNIPGPATLYIAKK